MKKLFGQPFGYPVQLVNLDLKYPLLPKSDIETALQTAALFQHSANPMQTVYITPDLKARGYLGRGRKINIPFCQKVKSIYIDGRRNKNFGDILINRLYPLILNIDSRESLEQFLLKYPEFCDFPSQQEHEYLKKQYPKDTEVSLDEVRAVNLDFLLEKIKRFQQFLRSWVEKKKEREKMVESDFLWLNNELEKVSPIITGYSGYVWTGVQTEQKPKKKLLNIVGMRNADETTPIYAYHVYGYFAFCCLELLYDMRNKVPAFVCERCGKLNTKKIGSRRTTCSRTDNLDCAREGDAVRKKRSRET